MKALRRVVKGLVIKLVIMKKLLIGLAVIVVLTNLPPLNYFLITRYTYSNADGSFTYNEEGGKGKSFKGCKRMYGYFLQDHPNVSNKQLYRTFKLQPWKFWEWYQYIFRNERFTLPYKGN